MGIWLSRAVWGGEGSIISITCHFLMFKSQLLLSSVAVINARDFGISGPQFVMQGGKKKENISEVVWHN